MPTGIETQTSRTHELAAEAVNGFIYGRPDLIALRGSLVALIADTLEKAITVTAGASVGEENVAVAIRKYHSVADRALCALADHDPGLALHLAGSVGIKIDQFRRSPKKG